MYHQKQLMSGHIQGLSIKAIHPGRAPISSASALPLCVCVRSVGLFRNCVCVCVCSVQCALARTEIENYKLQLCSKLDIPTRQNADFGRPKSAVFLCRKTLFRTNWCPPTFVENGTPLMFSDHMFTDCGDLPFICHRFSAFCSVGIVLILPCRPLLMHY